MRPDHVAQGGARGRALLDLGNFLVLLNAGDHRQKYRRMDSTPVSDMGHCSE